MPSENNKPKSIKDHCEKYKLSQEWHNERCGWDYFSQQEEEHSQR